MLRQTCIAVIMAQLGCYVPCESLRMTCFDRIFTRIGANDNILAGQSTFMVELSETSKILREASPRSLVCIDANLSRLSWMSLVGEPPLLMVTRLLMPYCITCQSRPAALDCSQLTIRCSQMSSK